MARQLRLAFAMGGGVSLGTFSGAALSEAIKLAVLRARWRGPDGGLRPYDDVVIDVFSGASAGAMALALMLRGLTHRTRAQERRAKQRLLSDFGDEFAAQFEALPRRRQRDLIAAQVVQDVQERVWVDEISLERLLGRGPDGEPRDLRHEPGLLDRGAVDELARMELLPPGDAMPLDGRRLLASRVLFACALSNVTPVLYDARSQGDAHRAGYLGLGDGLTSWGHRELRVFDLTFEPRTVDASSRWCRYHASDEVEGRIGDLRARRTWSKIAATAIAAGAFPFAFAPVVLKRRRYEYGERLWPKRLADLDEYPFTYVDGGTFNNEPIREAFRLAAFIDALEPGAGFDRRVLFVDPRVGGLTASMRAPVHRDFFLEEPNAFGSIDGLDLRRRATLDRLKAQAGTVAAAVLNEATTIEEDKVYGTISRFATRDSLRDRLGELLRSDVDDATVERLKRFCEERLGAQADRLIPRGSLRLAGELERVAAELPEFTELRGGAAAFVALDEPSAAEHTASWAKALAFLALDLAMGLGGKREKDGLIAIAPFVELASESPIAKPLPGGAVKGFGGFASPVAGEYEVVLARHCAREFMEVCELIERAGSPPAVPEWSEADERTFRGHLEIGLGRLAERARAVVSQSHLVRLFPGIQEVVRGRLASWVHDGVLGLADSRPAALRFEFRVRVPDKRFELDGKGVGDRDIGPVRLRDGSLALVTFAAYRPGTGDGGVGWSGPHVEAGRTGPELRVHRDRAGPLPDRAYCSIALPGEGDVMEADRWPCPIFVGELDADAHEHEQEIPDFWRVVGLEVDSLEDSL